MPQLAIAEQIAKSVKPNPGSLDLDLAESLGVAELPKALAAPPEPPKPGAFNGLS